MGFLKDLERIFVSFFSSSLHNDKNLSDIKGSSFNVVDNVRKICPRCHSTIQINRRYCPWCGYNEEGVITKISNWKSEADLHKEKRERKINLPFGVIDLYLYELLEYVNKYHNINIEEVFSNYEKQGYKELLTLNLLRPLTAHEIIDKNFTLKELRKIAKDYGIKTTLSKLELLQEFLKNEDIKSKILSPLKQKYSSYYALDNKVITFFTGKSAEEKVDKKQTELEFLNHIINTPFENLEYKDLIKIPRPKILDFLSDDDFNYLIILYIITKNIKYTNLITYFEKVYNYPRYDWNVCLQIYRTYLLYRTYTKKNIVEMKAAGIKKVKLICHEECECCSKILDKPISISRIKELPIINCPLEVDLCKGATYVAVLDYDD